MKLDHNSIQHLATLAKIELSAQEQDAMLIEVSAILDVIDTLNNVDTTQVQPTAQLTGLTNVTRADEPNYTFERSDMLATMPNVDEEGYLKVHAVFTEDSPSH